MKLLNVRLCADDARMITRLQKNGVQISRLVRDAIRAEYERRLGRQTKRRSAVEIMKEIYARHPEPPGLRPRGYDLRDRGRVRAHIVEKLRREHP